MELTFFYRRAGLVSLCSIGNWAIHLFPSRKHWKWGHSVEEYQQCLDYWGLGPLLLVARCNI